MESVVLFAGVRCLQERDAGCVLKPLVGIGWIKEMYPALNNFQVPVSYVSAIVWWESSP